MAARLSVIVPVYGTEKYLRTCLDSLAQQTLREAEFLLVDDASPDGSLAIMQEYAVRDSRFRILRHERNKGLYQARLTGVRAAQGDYIAFLDSDDYVSVDFYRAAADRAAAGGFEVVMGDTVFVSGDGSAFMRPVHHECVPEDELYGDEIRIAFYGQELQCYSWHTVWNKIYARALFERCLPDLEKLTEHVIMTEDVAFSCVLLYEARSFARHRGDGVFYCMHNASATGAAFSDQKKFLKNYGDLVKVFTFADAFLAGRGDETARAHLTRARQWYCRMWQEAKEHCAASGQIRALADELAAQLAPGFASSQPRDDAEIWWFDKHTVPWNDGLEKIKRAIAGLDGCDAQIVSFDVFDTLIQRPFRQPSDVYCMLEDRWQQVNRRSVVSFAQARAEADASARAWAKDLADIPHTAIYQALRVTCGVTENCAEEMCRAEADMEITMCEPRITGVQLFSLAKAMGRRVVLTSDMYLSRETITAMLNKCGVDGWEAFFLSSELNALKWNGALYRCALKQLGVRPGQVLHIGDNWHNDVIKPRELGLRTLHHPRAMDVVTDVNRTQLGRLGLKTVSSFGGEASLQSALSFRCMQGLAAIRFFDNGFMPTEQGSHFGGNPALMGYYVLGGHVLALAQWLIGSAKRDGVRKLVFLARDGWLVKQAVDRLLTAADGISTDYCPASRRCLLPALTAHPSGFYELPINIPAYSVGKLMKLLDFCTVPKAPEELRRAAEEAGFSWDAPFPGKYRYHEFMAWYLANLYDGCRHQQAYNVLREYYEPILTEGAACFDMGYSGRLQAALSQLAGRGVPVYFVHDDEKEAPRLERAYGFTAHCFYPVRPGMSGAFREFLLSSDEPPCLGFVRNESGRVTPVYGRSEYNAAGRFLIGVLQRNALRFVQDYHTRFAGTPAEQVQPFACSMPFEDLLRYLPEKDLALFTDVRFEDTVFAGRDDLDLAGLVRDQAAKANQIDAGAPQELVGFIPSQTPLVKRTIGFLLFDRGLLKQKAKKRLQGHPVLMRVCKAGWGVLKGVRAGANRLFRKGGR